MAALPFNIGPEILTAHLLIRNALYHQAVLGRDGATPFDHLIHHRRGNPQSMCPHTARQLSLPVNLSTCQLDARFWTCRINFMRFLRKHNPIVKRC